MSTGVLVHALAGREWRLWGTDAKIVVTDCRALDDACALVDSYLLDVDTACSRFRDDSEINSLEGNTPTRVSPLLAELVSAALDAAESTDGAVDPTIGSLMIELGYDRDLAELPRPTAADSQTVQSVVTSAAWSTSTWSTVELDGNVLTVPTGVRLDLGATAKAFAADACAQNVFDALGCGVLVSLGGDIATAGEGPDGGWQILVQDGADQPASRVALAAGRALATSSTLKRRWAHGGYVMHHILDPHLQRPAESVWRTVSVSAQTCVEANTATTAAIVKGHSAQHWLEQRRVPARLVASDGSVTFLGGWPVR